MSAHPHVGSAWWISILFCAFISCSGPSSTSFEGALTLYRENKLEQALPQFERLAAQDEKNAEVLTWLAETYRRLGRKGDAVRTARLALGSDPCNSFAHTVLAEAMNPVVGGWEESNSDSTWVHLMKAVECDSTDGNPWLLVWGESIRRGDPEMLRKSLEALVHSRFLTKAALAYGRWMLRALPPNAILLTNGDMDTYPPCAVQEVEGFRKDVVVVNRGTLNTVWYARFIRDREGVMLPFSDAELERLSAYRDSRGAVQTPSDQIFSRWVDQKSSGSFGRPLAITVTVDEGFYSDIKSHLRFGGPFWLWQEAPSDRAPDMALMKASLEGQQPDDFSGPWVSDRDRSPIRRVQTKHLVQNITATVLAYCTLLMEASRLSEAERWLSWAEELESKSELGPTFTEKIAQLKKDLARRQRSTVR
jgi:tetratricopeptide (TPR) repeat protein